MRIALFHSSLRILDFMTQLNILDTSRNENKPLRKVHSAASAPGHYTVMEKKGN